MGQTTAAIEMLQKAVGNISPKSSLLYGRIGELIYAEGDKETGIEYLTEAVDIDPRNKRALEMLQHALRRRAESQAETLVTTDSSDLMEEEESQLTESVSSLPLSPPLLDRSVSVSETNTTSTPLTRNPPRKRVSMFF
jgi:tetratricopeptide (TPR) repeat protein